MSKTILIIDDFETTLYTVGMTLEHKNYNVIRTLNAEAALKELNGQEINLIISDYNMPGLNGVEFTTKVRENEKYCKVPVLILSTETSPEKKKDALEKGVTGWIKKPYQLEEFHKMINRVIR